MAATGTPTPNIGLRCAQGTDPASVDDINYNSNLLDTKLGAVGNDSVQDQLDSLNSNLINRIRCIRMNVQLDAQGMWGAWNYDIGYTNEQLLKAFTFSWNNVTVIGANNSFWQIKVDGLANQTVNVCFVIANAPIPNV